MGLHFTSETNLKWHHPCSSLRKILTHTFNTHNNGQSFWDCLGILVCEFMPCGKTIGAIIIAQHLRKSSMLFNTTSIIFWEVVCDWVMKMCVYMLQHISWRFSSLRWNIFENPPLLQKLYEFWGVFTWRVTELSRHLFLMVYWTGSRFL